MSTEVRARPLTRENCSAYCTLLSMNGDAARSRDTRADSQLSIELIEADLFPEGGSLLVTEMERHPTSVQAFIPIDVASYVVVVCGSTPDDVPDLSDLHAFIVPGRAILQYRPGVWHIGIRALGSGLSFGMAVNKAGAPQDCEFQAVSPFKVLVPAGELAPGHS